jgi:hypothetical protein
LGLAKLSEATGAEHVYFVDASSLGTNLEPSYYHSPYKPPAQMPRRFQNPPAEDDDDDDLPGPIERAHIATPIFSPVNYEPYARRVVFRDL